MRTEFDIAYGTHPNQKLDLYLPDSGGDFPVLVYFHGGGLTGGSKAFSDSAFPGYAVANGLGFVSAEYRMYPDAHFPDFICDAASAAAKTREILGSGHRLFITGSSAGAYLSMMLCFDTRYLKAVGISPADIGGYVFDAGQPTAHFNVLAERGADPRRVIVDETAPLWFVGLEKEYPPMLFLTATQDMENRHEQNELMLSTLRHFRYDMTRIGWRELKGTHCNYVKDAGFEAVDTALRHTVAFVLQYSK